jgi:hypothetical protein
MTELCLLSRIVINKQKDKSSYGIHSNPEQIFRPILLGLFLEHFKSCFGEQLLEEFCRPSHTTIFFIDNEANSAMIFFQYEDSSLI